MPTIDGYKLPPAILDAFQEFIDGVDKDLLLVYAKNHPDQFPGYRPLKSNAPTFRKRLKQKIQKTDQLSHDLCGLIALGGMTVDMIEVLSNEHLEQCLPDLMAIFGPNRILAGMLVDMRPKVRQAAIDFLTSSDNLEELQLPDDAQARQNVREWFFPLAGKLLDEISMPESDEAGDDDKAPSVPRDEPPETGELNARIMQLEKDLKKAETRAHKEKHRLTKKVEQLQADKRKIEKEIARERKRAEDATGEARHAAKETEEIRAGIEQRVAEDTEQAISARVRHWLVSPRALDVEARRIRNSSPGDDVLLEAETLLEHQAKADKHFGNRRIIRERLDRLDRVKEALDTARTESLRPMPELGTCSKQVEEEVRRLQSLLRHPAPDRPILTNLIAHINEATSPEEIEHAQRLIEELEASGIITGADVRKLYAKYHQVMGRLYDAYAPRVLRGPEPKDPTWKMRKALDGHQPLLWLLDGHNILFNLPDWFEGDYENGVPGERARERLVDIVRSFVKDAPQLLTRIYFDGPTYEEINRSPSVKVIFSGGGQSDQRADRAIVGHLEFCCREYSAMPRIIVTDDVELSRRAKEFGASFIRLQQFAALVEESGRMVDDK